jgi:hypothetical protein
MLSGDLDTGKTIMRDYIKATVGFEKLGAATGAPPKSLIRDCGTASSALPTPREQAEPSTFRSCSPSFAANSTSATIPITGATRRSWSG